MTDLAALSPAAGRAPVTHAEVTLAEADLGPMTLIAPFRGQTASTAKLLSAEHGLDWPDAGQAQYGAVQAIWFGLEQVLLTGADPHPGLAAHAALVEQSDAWAALTLTGARDWEVMARLTPLDLRPAQFAPGRTARTLADDMQVSITRTPTGLLMLGFRSMAGTLWHEIERAMESLAARG